MTTTQTIWSRLANIPYKVVFIILIVWHVSMTLYPVIFPFVIDPNVQAYWDYIEDMPDGSVFLWDSSATAQNIPMIKQRIIPLWVHLWRQNIKILIVHFFTDGPMNTQNSLDVLEELHPEIYAQKTYGVDLVVLPYAAGEESSIAAFAADIRSVFPNDLYGTPLDELPMMDDINSAADFYAGRFAPASTETAHGMVRVYVNTYGVAYVYGNMGQASWSVYSPYYPKQMPHYFFDINANQYEALNNVPGINSQIFAATNGWSIIMLVIIALGNLGWFMIKRVEGE